MQGSSEPQVQSKQASESTSSPGRLRANRRSGSSTIRHCPLRAQSEFRREPEVSHLAFRSAVRRQQFITGLGRTRRQRVGRFEGFLGAPRFTHRSPKSPMQLGPFPVVSRRAPWSADAASRKKMSCRELNHLLQAKRCASVPSDRELAGELVLTSTPSRTVPQRSSERSSTVKPGNRGWRDRKTAARKP